MPQRGPCLLQLVVISILLVPLAVLLMPLVLLQRGSHPYRWGLNSLQDISLACEQYRNLDGAYPDSQVMAAVFLPGPQRMPVAATQISEAQWRVVSCELVNCLHNLDPEHFRPGLPVENAADPLHRVIRYRPMRYEPCLEGPHIPAIDSITASTAYGFQLWCAGMP